VALDFLAEESKIAPPDAVKYIDGSYLQQARKELARISHGAKSDEQASPLAANRSLP